MLNLVVRVSIKLWSLLVATVSIIEYKAFVVANSGTDFPTLFFFFFKVLRFLHAARAMRRISICI